MIPLWFVLALSAAIVTTAVPLVQEKFKVDGYALALWNKVFVIILTMPFLFYLGVPDQPLFYLYLAVTAVIYSISDVVFFRAVPVVGSGVVTRLLPVSVVITFFSWFIIDPQLWRDYMQDPYKMLAILAVLCGFLYCAAHLRKCTISWQGVQLLWPVIMAACLGPIVSKMALAHAGGTEVPFAQAPFAYVCVQSIIMTGFLLGYQLVKRPVSKTVILSRNVIRTGFILAVLTGIAILLKMKALQLVDNPGFVSLVVFTDALWVILIYRLIGKRETANIWAGLGIVASACAILLIKMFL